MTKLRNLESAELYAIRTLFEAAASATEKTAGSVTISLGDNDAFRFLFHLHRDGRPDVFGEGEGYSALKGVRDCISSYAKALQAKETRRTLMALADD